MSLPVIVLLVLVVALILYVIGVYNTLIKLRNRFQNAFAQIDVQLKRRHDLIPNLVETAKAYLAHERGTLESVTAARGVAMAGLARAAANPGDAKAVRALGEAEGALNGALSRLNVAVEAYPELKASQNMMQLSEELASTENRVAFARQAFNDAVMQYNTYRQSFPNAIFAVQFGHSRDAALLDFPDPQGKPKEAPKVAF
jgi:LemA protein